MQITAAIVKELRDKTGAGMMDCKKALTETDGDIDKAVDVLRAKVLQRLRKKPVVPLKKVLSTHTFILPVINWVFWLKLIVKRIS